MDRTGTVETAATCSCLLHMEGLLSPCEVPLQQEWLAAPLMAFTNLYFKKKICVSGCYLAPRTCHPKWNVKVWTSKSTHSDQRLTLNAQNYVQRTLDYLINDCLEIRTLSKGHQKGIDREIHNQTVTQKATVLKQGSKGCQERDEKWVSSRDG